jgi:RNA 2',3'-cyclic 3'-phosphodiesterase
VRLFIALGLPEPVEVALLSLIGELDPEGTEARWVTHGTIHVTLKFLGEVDEGRLDPLVQVLDEVRGPALDISVSGIGFFPNARAPRVIWVGVRSSRIGALQAEIERRTAGLGLEAAQREFQGHVTLGRAARRGTMGRSVVTRSGRFEGVEFGRFSARGFFLFRSRLNPTGAVHEKLQEFVFARD